MKPLSTKIVPEALAQANEIETITLQIFGPGMFARAAFVLREGVAPELPLCFTAICNDRIVGTVRQTRIMIGETKALLLGPLGVLPEYKNFGIGKALMENSIAAAKDTLHHHDAGLILLVGDLPYYRPFGFRRVPADQIIMPRPVDLGRTLALELKPVALAEARGSARRSSSVPL